MNACDMTFEDFLGLLLGVDVNGKHKHRCDCGCIWEHPNSRAGNVVAHCCPKCHEVLPGAWWHYDGPEKPAFVEGPDGLPLAA